MRTEEAKAIKAIYELRIQNDELIQQEQKQVHHKGASGHEGLTVFESRKARKNAGNRFAGNDGYNGDYLKH